MILITGADSYMGYCIASHLARHTHLVSRIRVLCSTDAKLCLSFSRKGLNLFHDMDQAMQGVDTVVMAIGDERNRVDYYRQLCLAAARHRIKSMICVSHAGAIGPLDDFAAVEDHVIAIAADGNYQWTILRPDWILQHFFLWASLVDQQNSLPMPLPAQTELSPIDIVDVCSAVEALVLDIKSHAIVPIAKDSAHSGQVYILTGPETITIKQIIHSMAKASGAAVMKQRFVRLMDAKYLLENLKNNIWFDARIKHERHLAYHDPLDDSLSYSTRWMAPNDAFIDTIILYMDWIRRTAGSFHVPHANIILSRPLITVNDFFQRHAKAFQTKSV
ncbi:hypothetical protein BX666DRAFT_1912964 [Dichotomocladium elegans]|nr:hypothetical protein BX666DRAFT_1912964 [Dichotomocladium elegans]